MAIRRMNEMWRRLALHSVLSVLLLQGCQGEDTTVTQQSQGKITLSNAFIGTSLRPTINPTTLIPPVLPYTVGSPPPTAASTQNIHTANTASPTGARTSTNITIVDVNTNAPADATNNTKKEEDYVTAQFIPSPSESSPGNQALPANTEFTEKTIQFTISLQSESPTAEDEDNLQSESPTAEDEDNLQFRNVNVKARNDLQSKSPITEDENNSTETSSNKKEMSSSVFVPVLLTGLALAAVLIGVYVKKNNCQTKGNSMKLAEESDHADEENQGNTLVSVAPLNPPEDQEKPNQNGESLEAVKIQNPPAATNGHSATKADTEF